MKIYKKYFFFVLLLPAVPLLAICYVILALSIACKYVTVISFNLFTFIMSFLRFYRRRLLKFWSCDKLKTLYFDCQNIYDQQTWEDNDIHKEFAPIKSHDFFNTWLDWPGEVMWQIEDIIYPLPQSQWFTNFTVWWI